jgi:hypothetical protein
LEILILHGLLFFVMAQGNINNMNSAQAIDNLLVEFGDLVDQMQVILDRKAASKLFK